MDRQKYILTIIVFSQFACTSLWFAGNAILPALIDTYNYEPTTLGHITSSVQIGFIIGTLFFALLSIADRYSPSIVFMISAFVGAASNVLVIFTADALLNVLILRFVTGFFLAGIYPVGMKIAADWHEKGLGKALGFLVGALVLGTAFPHFINFGFSGLSWKSVLIATTILATLGGILVALFVPNGPYRNPGKKVDLSASYKVFHNHKFRDAAFGYFGHMWELYAFWAFIPVILIHYSEEKQLNFNISLASFLLIGIGMFSCISGGYASLKYGSKKVATFSLLLSGICCFLAPLLLQLSPALFFFYMIIWSLAVISDSPQFSTLVAQSAPSEIKGTALTIVNSIGFAITIISIQLLNMLQELNFEMYHLMILGFGPAFGLYYLLKSERAKKFSNTFN